MLVACLLPIVFGFFGFPFVARERSNINLLLAPVLGLAVWVLLAYFISADFRVAGSSATAMAASLLSLNFLVHFWFNKKSYCMRFKAEISPSNFLEAKWALFYILVAAVLLFPAFFLGVNNFFGSVNFDFFYNSQDSFYLSTHNVLQYTNNIESGATLPLGWSANSSGRFGIALIGSFAYKYFGINPLHFNSSLLSSLVVLNALAIAEMGKSLYGFGRRKIAITVFICLLSGGYAQGYTYYLLGQISSLPVFIAILIFTARVVDGLGSKKSIMGFINFNFLILVILLNALYVFYMALVFFAIAVFILSVLIKHMIMTNLDLKAYLRQVCVIALFFLISFLCLHLPFLHNAKDVLLDQSALLLRIAHSTDVPFVFTQYLTEAFLPLLMGLVNYPTSQSPLSFITGNGLAASATYLILGFFCLIPFIVGAFRVYRCNDPRVGARATVLALFGITFLCAIYFYCNAAPYAIFKLASWFMPLLLPLCLTVCILPRRGGGCFALLVFISSALVILLNLIAGFFYAYSFLSKGGDSFVNARNVNGMAGVKELRNVFDRLPRKKIFFALPNRAANAWVANEFRDYDIMGLAHNVQPLDEKDLPALPCSQVKNFPKEGYLITSADSMFASDITPPPTFKNRIFTGNLYAAYDVGDLENYVYIGRGGYSVEIISDKDMSLSGFSKKFRWVEQGIELYIYSKNEKMSDIDFEVSEGYVLAPKNRSLTVVADNKETKFIVNGTKAPLQLKNVRLNAGMNCIFIRSDDQVERAPRYGAVIRGYMSMDPRLLNFTIGDVKVNYKDVGDA